MFNHHFFEGQVSARTASPPAQVCCSADRLLRLQASSTLLQTFLTESQGRRAAMVADPPFGGLVRPLANTFSLISQMWRKTQHSGGCFGSAPFPLTHPQAW